MRIITLIEESYEEYIENNIPNYDYNKPEIYVAFIQKYIHLNYSSKINISDLCELVNAGRTTLINNFKLITGFTITDYIIEYRMRIAIRDLEFTSLAIREIAGNTGFNYDTYFIKQFLKRYGMSPSDFRKRAVDERKKSFAMMNVK